MAYFCDKPPTKIEHMKNLLSLHISPGNGQRISWVPQCWKASFQQCNHSPRRIVYLVAWRGKLGCPWCIWKMMMKGFAGPLLLQMSAKSFLLDFVNLCPLQLIFNKKVYFSLRYSDIDSSVISRKSISKQDYCFIYNLLFDQIGMILLWFCSGLED